MTRGIPYSKLRLHEYELGLNQFCRNSMFYRRLRWKIFFRDLSPRSGMVVYSQTVILP